VRGTAETWMSTHRCCLHCNRTANGKVAEEKFSTIKGDAGCNPEAAGDLKL
jgi:hypothetical protein